MNQLASFQGNVFIADINADGSHGKPFWAGNVPELSIAASVTNADKNESFSGQRGLYGRLGTANSIAVNGTFDEWIAQVLALGFRSPIGSIAAGSVTGEDFPVDLVANDLVVLDHAFVEDLQITDSAAQPVTVEPTKYRFEGHAQKTLRMLDVAGFTQPFRASYDRQAVENFTFFGGAAKDVYMLLDGIDTANSSPLVVEFWKLRLDPFANVGLIHAEYGALPFTSAALLDPTKGVDPELGPFGRMQRKKAA